MLPTTIVITNRALMAVGSAFALLFFLVFFLSFVIFSLMGTRWWHRWEVAAVQRRIDRGSDETLPAVPTPQELKQNRTWGIWGGILLTFLILYSYPYLSTFNAVRVRADGSWALKNVNWSIPMGTIPPDIPRRLMVRGERVYLTGPSARVHDTSRLMIVTPRKVYVSNATDEEIINKKADELYAASPNAPQLTDTAPALKRLDWFSKFRLAALIAFGVFFVGAAFGKDMLQKLSKLLGR